jgi:hypothetical protein
VVHLVSECPRNPGLQRPARGASLHPITLYGINEPRPADRWRSLFEATWTGYRRWYLSEGDAARPDLRTCRRMLTEYMPELLPTWTRMVELAEGDEVAARMLTLWDPPRFLPGCSQAVLSRPRPVLIRNYDYHPDLFERVVYSSAFTGRRVLGTGDCLWGLLDGMNDAGLAVSLAFGGRPGSAPGFGIPLVVRYLLEVAGSLREARQALDRLPMAMAYNLTIMDISGETVTAFVAPGGPAEVTDAPVATNHRGDTPDYPDHARSLRSLGGATGSCSCWSHVPRRRTLLPSSCIPRCGARRSPGASAPSTPPSSGPTKVRWTTCGQMTPGAALSTRRSRSRPSSCASRDQAPPAGYRRFIDPVSGQLRRCLMVCLDKQLPRHRASGPRDQVLMTR